MDLSRPIEPHPAKAEIRKHRIALVKVAQFCGCSYHHMSHILSGRVPPGKRIKRRLNELVEHLKRKEADSNAIEDN